MTDYKTFEPVEISEYLIKRIAAGLKKEVNDRIFKQIFKILNDNTVINNKNTLINAINSGRIYYENGAFRSFKPFSNAVSDELEKLGAKYKYGAYYIERSMLPLDIENTLSIVSVREAAKIAALNGFLLKLSDEIGKETLVKTFISKAVEQLFSKLEHDLEKTTQEGKIPVLELVRTDKQVKQVTKDYIENMDFWIQEWEEKEIIKMRQDVFKMVQSGARTETIKEYFINRHNIAERKAEFLAQNEARIASSVIKAAHYQAMGCTHFRWLRSISEKKRELHLEYAKETGNQYGVGGTNIFPYNDPPIIEQIEAGWDYIPKPNGQKGLPGQTYNCKCDQTGVKNPQYYKNRQKIENAKRNIFSKLKYAIENRKQRDNNPWRYRRFGEGQEV